MERISPNSHLIKKNLIEFIGKLCPKIKRKLLAKQNYKDEMIYVFLYEIRHLWSH